MENILLHLEVERLLKVVSIPRKDYSDLNKWIEGRLNKFVNENNLEENCCYFVKNIGVNNICFVHKFDGKAKSFQNLEMSQLPKDIGLDDVLIFSNGRIVVEEDITNEILKEKIARLMSLENSFSLFKEEGKEYIVCDKSDDIIKPQMSLKIEDTGKEYRKIDIPRELYEKLKVHDRVVYKNGEWKIVIF